MDRPLLIMDLDETLVFATDAPITDIPHFQCFHYLVHVRPHLGTFLDTVQEHYDLAIWTSAGEEYATCIVAGAMAGRELQFVWANERCTRRYDPERQEEYWVKDLRKVRKRGYNLEWVLVIDDTARKLERSYGNLVRVTPWRGGLPDDELLHLREYLLSLLAEDDFRRVEKRGWNTG